MVSYVDRNTLPEWCTLFKHHAPYMIGWWVLVHSDRVNMSDCFTFGLSQCWVVIWFLNNVQFCSLQNTSKNQLFFQITSSFIEGYLRTMPVINQNHLFGFFENHGQTYFRSAVRTPGYNCLPFPMSLKTGSPSTDPVFSPSHLQIFSFCLFPFFIFYHLWYPPKTGSLSTGSFHFVSCHRSPNQSRAAAAVQLRAAKLGGIKGQLSSWLELWFCGQQIMLAC